jgi:hypothetical protein
MANQFLSNVSQTWNNAATTYTALKINVTNAASAAASKLADLQIGGVSFFNVSKTGAVSMSGGVLPIANDVGALGSATLSFSDLFLASGAVINVANGNAVITHSSGIFTVSTGDLRVTTPGSDATSVVTRGATQTLTAKTLTSPVISGGTIDNAVIGGTTKAAIGGTTGTFTGAVSAVGLSSTTGTFSGAVSTVGLTGTTGTFSGAVSMAGLTATTGTFSGAVSMAGLTATTGSFSSTLGVSGLLTASAGINVTGTVTATTFSGAHSGSGASLTGLSATQLTTGTIPDARLPATVTNIDDLRLGASALLRFAGTDTGLDTYIAGVAGLGQWKSVCDAVEVFRCTSAAFAVSATGLISTSAAEYGFSVNVSNGETTISGNGITPLRVKRGQDGALVNWYAATTNEGSVSVSGATVTYGSFCGVHWSQWAGEPTTLRGTVLETVNRMSVWKGERNDTLPKVKISDTVGSRSVYGVYSHPDSEDPDRDFHVAAL